MNSEDKVFDFCLSLIYAGKNIEDYKEYSDLRKSVDSRFLKEIKQYQCYLQNYNEEIEYFVNEEYNILTFLLLLNPIKTFEELIGFMLNLSQEDAFKLLSNYILETQKKFSAQSLLSVSLDEKNKWKLIELYYDYQRILSSFIETIQKAWKEYVRLTRFVEEHFSTKIEDEMRRLSEKNNELFNLVFQNYISEEDFNSARQYHLFLASFQKILFLKVNTTSILGMGIFTFDYLKFIQDNTYYNQEKREKILKILADPTRFGILKLINEGISSNKILANKFGISSAAISYQLKNLLENELIQLTHNSKKYTVNHELLKHILFGIEKELFLQ